MVLSNSLFSEEQVKVLRIAMILQVLQTMHRYVTKWPTGSLLYVIFTTWPFFNPWYLTKLSFSFNKGS